MDDQLTAANDPPGAWRDFLLMPVRPRLTMRRVLDRPRDRAVLPLLLLSIVSAALADTEEIESLLTLDLTVQLTVLGVALAVLLLTVGAFFLFSWLVAAIGRILGGIATARETRSAFAWALIPSIWALLYRIPIAVMQKGQDQQIEVAEGITIAPAGVDGCMAALALGVLEFIVFAWMCALAVLNFSVAAGLSPWRSFSAIVLGLMAPVILIILSLPLIR